MKLKAVIEIPEGSQDKIEVKDGVAKVDRIVTIPYPVNYGFIPDTLAEDGDPLDIFVISKNPLKTLDNVDVTVLGVFQCTDQNIADDKVFATLSDEKFDYITLMNNMAQIGNFLLNYKEGFKVNGYKSLNSLEDLEKYKV